MGLLSRKVWMFKCLPFLRSRGKKVFRRGQETDDIFRIYFEKNETEDLNLLLTKASFRIYLITHV